MYQYSTSSRCPFFRMLIITIVYIIGTIDQIVMDGFYLFFLTHSILNHLIYSSKCCVKYFFSVICVATCIFLYKCVLHGISDNGFLTILIYSGNNRKGVFSRIINNCIRQRLAINLNFNSFIFQLFIVIWLIIDLPF